MTRNLKHLSLLCAAAVLINFISSWYYEELFFHFFVLYSIVDMIFFFFLAACGIWSVKYLKGNHKSIKDFIPLILVVIYFSYLLSGGQNKLNFIVYPPGTPHVRCFAWACSVRLRTIMYVKKPHFSRFCTSCQKLLN